MTFNLEIFYDLNIFQISGMMGFFCYLLAFGSVQLDMLQGNSPLYSALNIVAAALVSVSLIADFNLASALIQGSWIVIGIIGLIRHHLKRKTHTHFNTGPVTSFGAVQ